MKDYIRLIEDGKATLPTDKLMVLEHAKHIASIYKCALPLAQFIAYIFLNDEGRYDMAEWADNKLPNGALICYTYPNSSDVPVYMRIDERRMVGIRERSIRIYKSDNDDAAINIDSYNLINCPSNSAESTLRSCQKFLGEAFSSLSILVEMGKASAK